MITNRQLFGPCLWFNNYISVFNNYRFTNEVRGDMEMEVHIRIKWRVGGNGTPMTNECVYMAKCVSFDLSTQCRPLPQLMNNLLIYVKLAWYHPLIYCGIMLFVVWWLELKVEFWNVTLLWFTDFVLNLGILIPVVRRVGGKDKLCCQEIMEDKWNKNKTLFGCIRLVFPYHYYY